MAWGVAGGGGAGAGEGAGGGGCARGRGGGGKGSRIETSEWIALEIQLERRGGGVVELTT